MDINKFFTGLSDIFASGRIDQVSEYLCGKLKDAEKEDDKGAIITILNEMVGYFRSVSAYPDAIAAAERALSMMREMGLEMSVPYGTTLLNAATAYRISGNSPVALRLFEEALAILTERLPEDDPRLAGLYNNLSAIHQDAGEYEKARKALERAAAIMAPLPELAIDLATVYSNLALVLASLKRDEEAMRNLRKAMDIFEREGAAAPADARKAPHYAAALAGFAAAYYNTKQFTRSAEVYEEALERIKDCFGENRDYAVTCRNCAEAYIAIGNAEKARSLRKRADRIMEGIGLA